MTTVDLLDKSTLISWIISNDLSVDVEDFKNMPNQLIYELYADALAKPGSEDVWFYVDNLASGGLYESVQLDTEAHQTIAREAPDPHIDSVRTVLIEGFEKSYSYRAFEAAQVEYNEAPAKYWGLVWIVLTSSASTVFNLRPENIQRMGNQVFSKEMNRLTPEWSQISLESYVNLHEEVARKVKDWSTHE